MKIAEYVIDSRNLEMLIFKFKIILNFTKPLICFLMWHLRLPQQRYVLC